MQMSARNAFGARYVFDGRSHDRLAQRSSGLRMLLGPSPPGSMRRSIAPSVVGTPTPQRPTARAVSFNGTNRTNRTGLTMSVDRVDRKSHFKAARTVFTQYAS